MPVFEFYCEDCQRDFEELIRSQERDRGVTCPSCGGRQVARKMSVFSARAGTGSSRSTAVGGGCGRCGDPQGPCRL